MSRNQKLTFAILFFIHFYLSLLDFVMAPVLKGLTTGLLDGVSPSILDDSYPELVAYIER